MQLGYTAEHINERNRQFWLQQSTLLAERITDETLLEIAARDMHWETLIGVSPRLQKSLEKALEDAEVICRAVQSAFSRKGRRAPRRNALQNLIREIVERNPAVTEGHVLLGLRRQQKDGVIVSVDEESDVLADESRMIHFVNEDGTPKRAPISGLKDRLFRIKKK